MDIKNTKTNRGFSLLEFHDFYDSHCSIQKSSLAEYDAIWIGVDDPDPKVLASQASAYGIKSTQNTGWIEYPIPDGVQIKTRMHLTIDQVKILLPILQHFVDTGELPDQNLSAEVPTPEPSRAAAKDQQ